LSGAVFLDVSVGPSSTDSWRGHPTLLLSPLAISQLSAGGFFIGGFLVDSLLFRSKDFFVTQPSLKVRFVIRLLNI
jgi:hypothetical protein